MAATCRALAGQIDPAVHSRLVVLASAEGDADEAVREICAALVPNLGTDELVLAIRCFTGCLKTGGKHMRLPLYLVVATVGTLCEGNESVRRALVPFGNIFQHDKQEARKSFAGLSDFFSGFGDEPAVEPVTPELVRSELFERIVCVSAPHLHERSWNGISVVDLIELPPIVPRGFSEALAALAAEMRGHRFDPFTRWNEVIEKMETFLADAQFVLEMNRDVSMKSVFTEAMLGSPSELNDAPREAVAEAAEAAGYSWGFCAPNAKDFLPTEEYVNTFGTEILGE